MKKQNKQEDIFEDKAEILYEQRAGMLHNFIAERKSQGELIIPKKAFAAPTPLSIPEGYFPQPETNEFAPMDFSLYTFKYLYNISELTARIQSKKYLSEAELIKSLVIRPTLCKDNALYCVKNGMIAQISMDTDHPRFMAYDILKRTAEKLSWKAVENIIGEAVILPEAQKTALLKLKSVYNAPQKSIPQVLPSFAEVYTYHALGFYYENLQGNKDFSEKEAMFITPTLCEPNVIMAKRGVAYYRIQFDQENSTFVWLINDNQCVMTENELNMIMYDWAKSAPFKDKTPEIVDYIKKNYARNIAPVFDKRHQVSLKEFNAYRKKKNVFFLKSKGKSHEKE